MVPRYWVSRVTQENLINLGTDMSNRISETAKSSHSYPELEVVGTTLFLLNKLVSSSYNDDDFPDYISIKQLHMCSIPINCEIESINMGDNNLTNVDFNFVCDFVCNRVVPVIKKNVILQLSGNYFKWTPQFAVQLKTLLLSCEVVCLRANPCVSKFAAAVQFEELTEDECAKLLFLEFPPLDCPLEYWKHAAAEFSKSLQPNIVRVHRQYYGEETQLM
jgi:hypothetical protein